MENAIKSIQEKVLIFLKKNNPNASQIKLCPSEANKKLIIKLLKHTISVADKNTIEDKTLFTYKSEQKDDISGETINVEKTIKIGQALSLVENGVCEIEDFENAFSKQKELKHKSRKDAVVYRNRQGLFIHDAKFNQKSEERSYELAVPIQDSKYTNADKYFFSWWKRDSMNNIYFITKDKHLILVPLKEDSQAMISSDKEFWTEFWKTHRDDFISWEKTIIEYIYDKYESEENDTFTDYNMSIDLHKTVPRIILNSLSIVLTFQLITETYTDENDQQKTREIRTLSSVNVAVKQGKSINSSNATFNEDNLKDELRYKMAHFDLSELNQINRFTNNDKNDGNSFFNIPKTLWQTDEKTDLPEIWSKFLLNKFKVDTKEQLYRLANWVISVVDAENLSRQALVLCGEGNDGKSTFIDVMSTFFNNYTNNKFAVPCPPDGFDLGNTQNGLINCIDARLITISDASDVKKIITNDAFKNVTGGDVVVCQKKYAAPISKKMTGTKLLISTNNVVYMPQGCDTSRVIPIYFHPRDKNEADFDIVELKNSLIETFPDFIKWCYWFSKSINEHYGIEKNRTRIFSFDGSKTTKQCFETLCYKTQKFRYEVQDEFAEEDTDWFSQFIDENIAVDEDSCIDKVSLLVRWDKFAQDNKLIGVYKMQPKSSDLRKLYNMLKDLGEGVDCNFIKCVNGRTKRVIKGVKLIDPISDTLEIF